MLRVNVAGVDLLGAHISQDADFCAEFVLKPVRKIEAFLKRSNSPMISICNSSKCVPVWGLRALTLLCALVLRLLLSTPSLLLIRLCLTQWKLFGIAIFRNHNVNLLAFRLNLVELAFVLAWPIYVASRKQSQDLQSRTAPTAPFDSDSLIPILAAHPLLQHVQNDDLQTGFATS
jgi:hypothetical protein